MKTYVIFDRGTGEILQTHVDSDDVEGDLDELLRMARPDARAEDVEAVAVDDFPPGAAFSMDLKSRKLVRAEPAKVHGSGGASVQPARREPRTARTVFFDAREGAPGK